MRNVQHLGIFRRELKAPFVTIWTLFVALTQFLRSIFVIVIRKRMENRKGMLQI